MRIGIDGRALVGPLAGTGRYVFELCRVLHEALPYAEFVIFGSRPMVQPVASARWTVEQSSSGWASRLSAFSWYQLLAGRQANKVGIDLFWGGANFLPLGLSSSIKSVLTVHDLNYKIFGQSMSVKHRLAYELFFRASLRRADVLVSNSEGTAKRIKDHGLGLVQTIVRPGASDLFKPASTSEIALMRKQLGLSQPYLLSLSTLEPRKNLPTLVQAFLMMRQQGQLADTELVLVGQQGWKNEALNAVLAKAGEYAQSVRFTGFVEDQLLPSLYSGSVLTVMPSIYEGFGMPALEAGLCAARVLATDIPELREAAGDTAVYVEPTVQGIQEGILQALSLPPITEPTVARLTWQDEGAKLAALFERLSAEKSIGSAA